MRRERTWVERDVWERCKHTQWTAEDSAVDERRENSTAYIYNQQRLTKESTIPFLLAVKYRKPALSDEVECEVMLGGLLKHYHIRKAAWTDSFRSEIPEIESVASTTKRSLCSEAIQRPPWNRNHTWFIKERTRNRLLLYPNTPVFLLFGSGRVFSPYRWEIESHWSQSFIEEAIPYCKQSSPEVFKKAFLTSLIVIVNCNRDLCLTNLKNEDIIFGGL